MRPPGDLAPGDLWLGGSRLGVRFFFCQDRYAQRIYVPHDAGWRAVLESLEGTPHDAWPSSPPFQSATLEHKPEGPVILLVGMAGKSHWSASVELDASAEAVRFDVACRAMTPPRDALGSRYRALGDLSVNELRLDFIAGPASHCEPAPPEEKRIAIACAIPPAATGGKQTVRWSYSLRAAGASSPS
jgi:hypothetical protein